MATIIVVHGTFDGGTDNERRWWAFGGRVHSFISSKIEVLPGQLNWFPFRWNGANSESSRRRAGVQLLKQFEAFDRAGEPFIVIGHSHGGSVIEHALLSASDSGKNLLSLKSWITIGTPFLSITPKNTLFASLPVYAQRAIVTLSTCLFALIVSLFVIGAQHGRYEIHYLDGSRSAIDFGWSNPFDNISTASLAFCVAALLYNVFHVFKVPISKGIWARKARSFGYHYGSRWIGIIHPDDEAFLALKMVSDRKMNFFQPSLLSEAIKFVASFAIPLLVLALAISSLVLPTITTLLKINIDPSAEGLASRILIIFYGLTKFFSSQRSDNYFEFFAAFAASALSVSFVLIVITIISMVTIRVSAVGIGLSSRSAAFLLNEVSRKQAIRTAFGVDVVGEFGQECSMSPRGITRQPVDMPYSIQNDISVIGSEQLGGFVTVLRPALTKALVDGENFFSVAININSTQNNGLIHTSYFNSECFLDWLARFIVSSDGFNSGGSVMPFHHHAP